MCAVGAGFGVAETGSEKQKREILPNVVKGDVAFSYGLSEPGVGADLGNVTTRGDRDGDRLIINGAKRWTSGASMNEYINALVRTGPPKDKRNNLSFVLVPTDAPGVTITELGSMGHNGTPLTDVTFDDVELTMDDVLGGGEGWNNGWSILAGPWLESEKLISPAIALGIAEAALAEAWTYSQERIQGGKRICGHQTIRHALSDARTELQACRLMLMHAAWLVQERKPSAVATSMAKLFVAEKAKVVTLTCQQQVMGAYGYAHGFQMERYVRDSLAVPIYGGSSAVMRNNIANLLKLPRS